MWWSRPVHLAFLAVMLTATASCGFKPLYGDIGRTGAAQTDLAFIEVDEPQERSAQRLRQILVANLSPQGQPVQPKYRLAVRITEGQEGVGLRTDFTYTRINYRLTGAFTLVDHATGKQILGGTVRGVTAYNVGQDQVATVTAETDARERALQDMARDLQTRMALFFENRTAKK